jgi:hypothetical protein
VRFPLASALLSALSLVVVSGCGAPDKPSKYPARAEGCEVQVFPESPTMPTDNIGPVSAICGADISDDDCQRTLKDETCKLGGDVVWGVADISKVLGKKRLNGRAAHTKAAGATPSSGK